MGITEERIKRITERAAAMKAVGKASVDVSSELGFLVSDNAAMEAEIRVLEEANGRLRERLNRGENHDAYMKLPLDADGVPIHISDTVWYIGIDVGIAKDYPLKVDGFVMEPFDSGIFIETQEFQRKAIAPESLTHEQPEPADSWAKLEEDAKQRVCSYFGIDQENTSCEDCPHGSSQTGCICGQNARLDIVARAKKLAGIEELEGGER